MRVARSALGKYKVTCTHGPKVSGHRPSVDVLFSSMAENVQCKMVGIIMNGCMEHSLTSLEGFLNTENMPPIPIGVDLEAGDFGGNPPYQKNLAKYARRFSKNEEAEDPVRLYRRLLAEAEEPLEFIEVGYMQTIAALLESGPDDISPLDGTQLMGEKCSVIWAMAGE